MTNVAFGTLEEYDDVEVVNLYHEWKEAGRDTTPLLKAVQQQGRDNARTPMQWSAGLHAGFTTGSPWLTINSNYTEINVEDALADEQSILQYYKNMLAYRKANKTLIHGRLDILLPESEELFVYRRYDDEYDFLIMLNFTSNEVDIDKIDLSGYQLELSNVVNADHKLTSWGAMVYKKVITS